MCSILRHVTLLVGMTFTCFIRLDRRLLLLQLGLPLIVTVALLFVGLFPMHTSNQKGTDNPLSFHKFDKGDETHYTVAYCPETKWTRQVVNQIKLRLRACENLQFVFVGYTSEKAILKAHKKSPKLSSYSKNKTNTAKIFTHIDLALVFRNFEQENKAEFGNSSKNTGHFKSQGTLAVPEIIIRPRLTNSWQHHYSNKMGVPSISSCPENRHIEDMSFDVNFILQLVVESIVKINNPNAPHMEIKTSALPLHSRNMLRGIIPILITLAFLPGSALLASYFRWKHKTEFASVLRLYGVGTGRYIFADLVTVVVHSMVISCTLLVPFNIGHYTELFASANTLHHFLLLITYGLAANSFAFFVSTIPDATGKKVPLWVVLLHFIQLTPTFMRRFTRSHTGILSFLFYGAALDMAVEILLTGPGTASHLFVLDYWTHGQGLPKNQMVDETQNFFSLVFIVQAVVYCFLGIVGLGVRRLLVDLGHTQTIKCKPKFCFLETETEETFPSVCIKEVCYQGHAKDNLQNLQGVSFEIRSGETVAVLGPAMSGKTTLVKILTGQIRNYTGYVHVGGVSPLAYVDRNPGSVGLCPQQNYVPGKLKVREMYKYFNGLNTKHCMVGSSKTLIQEPLLVEMKHLTCDRLSLFGLKLLKVDIAYLNSPLLVVLDEPTTGLGESFSLHLENSLKKRKPTTMFSTSSAKLALNVADRIVLMAEGQVLFVGTGQELKESLGGGYYLSIELRSNCNIRALTNYLRLFVPRLYVFSTTSKILMCVLPDTPAATSKFEFFLANLQWKKKALGVAHFSIQRVTVDNLLEWLPDMRCLRARLKQISDCRGKMEEFQLEKLLVKASASEEPTVVYSALRKTMSNDDIYSLQKELNKLCLNNSNSAQCSSWNESGDLIENCVDMLWYCDADGDSRAVDPPWRYRSEHRTQRWKTRVMSKQWCCGTSYKNRILGCVWFCDALCETEAPVLIQSEIRFSDIATLCKRSRLIDAQNWNRTSKNTAVFRLKASKKNFQWPFFVLLNLSHYFHKRLSKILHKSFQLTKLSQWVACPRTGFTIDGWNLSSSPRIVWNCIVLICVNTRACIELAVNPLTNSQCANLHFKVVGFLSPYSLWQTTQEFSRAELCSRLKIECSTKRFFTRSSALTKYDKAFQRLLNVKLSHSKGILNFTQRFSSRLWTRQLLKQGKLLFTQQHYRFKPYFRRSLANKTYNLRLQHSTYCKTCIVMACTDFVHSGIYFPELQGKTHFVPAMDRNQSANPDSFTTMTSLHVAVNKVDPAAHKATWGVFNMVASVFKVRELLRSTSTPQGTISSRSGSGGSRNSSLIATVPYQVLGNLESYLELPPVKLTDSNESFIRQESPWRIKFWHIYVALHGKLLVYIVRDHVCTFFQLFIPLTVAVMVCLMPVFNSTNEKLTMKPCKFAPYHSFVRRYPEKLGLFSAYKSVLRCQNNNLNIKNTYDKGAYNENGLAIHANFRMSDNNCHNQITTKIFYDSNGCLFEIWGVTTLLQAYYRCFYLRMPTANKAVNMTVCPGRQKNHASLQLSIQPLPTPGFRQVAENQTLVTGCVVTSIALMMSLSWLTATFICVLVTERRYGFCDLQRLNGLPGVLHLVAMAFCHLTISSVSTLLVVLALALIGSPLLDAASVIQNMAFYVVAALPQMYVLQLCFRDCFTGILILGLLNSTLGTLCFWPLYDRLDLDLKWSATNSLPDNWGRLWFVRLVVPSTSLTETLYHICALSKNCEDGQCFNELRLRINFHVGVMILHLIIWSCILYLTNVWFSTENQIWRLFTMRSRKATRSNLEDISIESGLSSPSVLKGLDPPPPAIVVEALSTVGKNSSKKILKNVSFNVSTGSCLGILGGDGAGKSTLLQLMAGLKRPQFGTVNVCPTAAPPSIYGQMKNQCGNVTFCLPSYRLMPVLTGRETLQLLGWLRKVPPAKLLDEISCLLDIFQMTSKADTVCARLSLADKMKLRLCAALIGDPQIILLNLPNHGLSLLDYKALGDVFARLRSGGCTVVLATENANVCEALSTEMSLLHHGVLNKLKAVTDIPGLMLNGSKYCQGYSVDIIFTDEDPERHAEFFNEAAERIENIEIFTDEKNSANFHLLGSDVNVAKLFVLMEDGVLHHGVLEYSVFQVDVGFLANNTPSLK